MNPDKWDELEHLIEQEERQEREQNLLSLSIEEGIMRKKQLWQSKTVWIFALTGLASLLATWLGILPESSEGYAYVVAAQSIVGIILRLVTGQAVAMPEVRLPKRGRK